MAFDGIGNDNSWLFNRAKDFKRKNIDKTPEEALYHFVNAEGDGIWNLPEKEKDEAILELVKTFECTRYSDMQLLEMIKNIETQTDWDRIEKSNEQSLRDKKLKRSDIDGDDNGDDDNASPTVPTPVIVP